jgi:carbon-monoxide dehydrogenase large subunit
MLVGRYVGAQVRRKEDPRLITGAATYVDDLQPPNTLHMAIVRSPYPHARIRHVDVAPALAVPGVVLAVTGAEIDGYIRSLGGHHSTPADEPHVEPLATARARFVGQPVAAVLADSRYAARDGADAVAVNFEPLEPLVDLERAAAADAPRVWDGIDDNLGERWDRVHGDVEGAFRHAEVVVRARLRSQKLAAVPMETRAVLADFDPTNQGLTIWSATQSAHRMRNHLADRLGLSQAKVRVIAPEVGGGFGVKIDAYPEDYVAAALAYKLRRPVKWIETRSENLLVTNHGRGQIAEIELAADRSGRITGYRLEVLQDLGAYPKGLFLPELTGVMTVGCYDIPAIEVHIRAIYTNTMAVAAYRGAGRPEAAYYIERGIELLAAELGMSPVEIRRRNFIRPEQFPYRTASGEQYDTGDYAKALDRALELSDYHELRRQQQAARRDGRIVGVGLASFVEICGTGPWESATVRVEPSGDVSVFTGISPHGQGQETTFAQIVADNLGADFDRIVVHHGDTASTPFGRGTMASRGLAMGGAALMLSVGKVRDKAFRIAAHLLEASVDDVELARGRYRIKGAPDQSVSLADIAALAFSADLPSEIEHGLQSTDFFTPEDETFPFGTHVAMVEIAPETGEVKILRYVAVDDCGVIISPLLVEGQIHGGLAQGIAQALFEEVVYDDTGQLLSGTLMDYAIPKAHNLPHFVSDHTVTPTYVNSMGAKGVGEASTIGSTPAVANAIMDALRPFGIRHLDLPLTPQKLWQAMQNPPDRP